MDDKNFGRRKFLRSSLLASGAFFIAPIIVSCAEDDILKDVEGTDPDFSTLQGGSLKNFDFGVASFDPTESSIIIWTKYKTTGAEITWEIAEDAAFKKLIRQSRVTVDSLTHNTIAIEIKDLKSNAKYFYRFYNAKNKDVSVVGETITLPSKTETIAAVKFAVTSCSNFSAGLFNVYKEIANSKADVVLHLGDYIYEYSSEGYGFNEHTIALNRQHKPSHQLVTLSDYRERYEQYRGDKNLQLAHQKKPFICVWDDHEIANNAYKDGAENHKPDKDGDYNLRKAAAIQAYSEFIPMKSGKGKPIYRSFDFGNILSLHMLDTRIIGRDKGLEITNFLNDSHNGIKDIDTFNKVLNDPGRNLMGAEQLSWLSAQLNASSATWQVLGQQVLMGKMQIPYFGYKKIMEIYLEKILNNGKVKEQTLQELFFSFQELIKIKIKQATNPSELTQDDKEKLKNPIPYNLDSWDGYPAERNRLYQILKGKKIISIAGDTHNAWHTVLKDDNGEQVGYEFATSSVTSPGMEEYIGIKKGASSSELFEKALATIIDELQYTNLTDRGFMFMEFTPSNVKTQWIYLDTVFNETYTTSKKEVTI